MRTRAEEAGAPNIPEAMTTRELRERPPKPSESIEPCDVCEELIPTDEQCVCNQCGRLAHFSCHGLEKVVADFVCRTCVDDGKIGDPDDLHLKEGQAWVGKVEKDDDGDFSDGAEDPPLQLRGRTIPQQRAEELLYDDYATLLGTDDLQVFASETQSDDETRHKLVLLSLPVDHTWTDKDLNDEQYLRVGLLLLFNLIQGQDRLATSRSPHINYTHFSAKLKERVTNNLAMTEATEEAVQQEVSA